MSKFDNLRKAFKNYFSPGRGRRIRGPIRDRAALADYLDTRASHVAQTSLYGYLRTRAGTRYYELFDDAAFHASMNIAKWQIYLACLSDLSVFAGALTAARTRASDTDVQALLSCVADDVLQRNGRPEDAGDAFEAGVERLRTRLRLSSYGSIPDNESAFTESPEALVYWAPVVEEFKALDEEIVRNSVRFRWNETRRELRRLLEAPAVIASGTLEPDAMPGRG